MNINKMAGFALALMMSNLTFAQNITCLVVGVSDGDTLTCLTNEHQQLKVRLNQIDAPEKRQPFGNAAGRKLSSLVYRKGCVLKYD